MIPPITSPSDAATDRAVAAVRKWLDETERAGRFARRYTTGNAAGKKRVGDAVSRTVAAFHAARAAIAVLPDATVKIDGVQYRVTDGDLIHVVKESSP